MCLLEQNLFVKYSHFNVYKNDTPEICCTARLLLFIYCQVTMYQEILLVEYKLRWTYVIKDLLQKLD